MSSTLSCTACAVLMAAACSSSTPKPGARQATASPIPACTLLTTDEAAAALHLSGSQARPSPDSLSQAARGMSTCVFGPTEGIGDVVTVVTENGLPAMDAATLAAAVSDTSFGITAQPLEGFGVPAALSTDPPAVALQKGTIRIIVSAPSLETTNDLAAKALARLP